ncbi:hypothetical protein GN156_28930, partial [bacterium LRH843]|nr:hypothetical protein [bacterium LRH843]
SESITIAHFSIMVNNLIEVCCRRGPLQVAQGLEQWREVQEPLGAGKELPGAGKEPQAVERC